jgi:hypothetical protein
MYASFLGISEALHMAIFRQPLRSLFFDSLLSVIEVSVFEDYPSNLGRRSIELHYSMKSVFHAIE